MMDSDMFELSMSQQFQVEKFSRMLDSTKDPDVLRDAAKLMLNAYQKQRAATQWVLKQHLDSQWSGGIMDRI